jgi:hypothetical protein
MPKGLTNPLVAGHCFSTDRMMQGSTRVMPAYYITGQAAGTAAALCTEKACDVRDVDTGTLREDLRTQGAYLP